ncbi:MAG: hypothetical protein IPJ48_09620 [Propionivibrio sp.]|uniref:Uncharacterized protein n=1 Tax=Candidatus Propionivibrio dominans TaxID=2954373 RepID=A0A9D7FCT2_9RHOO|nr:hypothetical protein [Candidatus Propionivibrio dominans]
MAITSRTRLVRTGDPLTLDSEENQGNYAIGWQGDFRIEGELLEYEDNDALDKVTIHGYATSLLRRMMEKLGHLKP